MKISGKALNHLEKTIRNLQTASLDKSTNNGERDSLSEFLQSDEDIEDLIIQSVYHKDLKKVLDEALGILDQRTRTAIQSVYYQRWNMEGTAKVLGCLRQMVTQFGMRFLHPEQIRMVTSPV